LTLHILKEALKYIQKNTKKKINLNINTQKDAKKEFFKTIELLEK
jgi:hypothetical protein